MCDLRRETGAEETSVKKEKLLRPPTPSVRSERNVRRAPIANGQPGKFETHTVTKIADPSSEGVGPSMPVRWAVN